MRMPPFVVIAVLFVICFQLTFPVSTRGEDAKLDPKMNDYINAPILLIAELESVAPGPIAKSNPPIYHHTLHIAVEQVLRGDAKVGAKMQMHHSARQQFAPKFDVGEKYVIIAERSRGNLRVKSREMATDDLIAMAKRAAAVPTGWSVSDGKLLSPWEALGEKGWPGDSDLKAEMKCAATGRPALLVGSAVTFKVEPVPPAKEIKWTNPDGDGEYRITVSNETDKPIEVPALLTDGKRILWEESLVIVCQGKTYAVPGATGVGESPKAVMLKSGESQSTIVNALRLEGPDWPRGGYRISFQFCLGERSSVQSFYYMSRHHDKLREAPRP